MNCGICKRPLDDPNDALSVDCGGDCLRCMADAGDPDAIRFIRGEFLAFAPGDRVTRPTDVYRKSRLMRGVVTSVYCSVPTNAYPWRNDELFSVQWEGKEEEHYGYFRHGLDRESTA